VQKFDNYPLNSRVFVEDFAAKLPTAPQFTVYARLAELREPFDKLRVSGVMLAARTQ
jgi:hypothetical protein